MNYQVRTLPEFLFSLKKEGIPEKDYQTHVSRYMEYKARRMGIPRQGHFELTPLCNLDCRMCYVHLHKEQLKGAPILDTEQWLCIMRQAVDAGMSIATLSGGECLLHPGFDAIYEFLMSRGVHVSVLTNGILLDRKMDLFRRLPPQHIQVTVYGKDDSEYRLVTGADPANHIFERVMTNIECARSAGLHVSVSITPNRFLGTACTETMDLLYDKQIPFRVNPELITPRAETGKAEAEIDLSLQDYIEIFRHYQSFAKLDTNEMEAQELPEIRHEESSSEPVSGLRCGAGRSSFGINWKGELVPCISMDISSQSLLKDGKVPDGIFQEAWKNANSICCNYQIPQDCLKCPYASVCTGCPPKHNDAAPGHCDPQICARTRKLVEAGILRLER